VVRRGPSRIWLRSWGTLSPVRRSRQAASRSAKHTPENKAVRMAISTASRVLRAFPAVYRPAEWALQARLAFGRLQEIGIRGFCHVPLPKPSSKMMSVPRPIPENLDPVACFESSYLTKTEWSVNVKSFLLGSQLDLIKLKPQFRDVLRAEGKVSQLDILACCLASSWPFLALIVPA
jgi:hypothetical protein